jgi:serine/threonine protein kinase
VTEQDGAPVPKVIDFGIAKATDKWAVENTLLTQFGQIVGTPESASPEQADTMTGDIDESSDVYSLGVLLYELLIGAVPFDTATLRSAGLAEMLRIIREEEAPSLSRKLTSMGAAVTDIAARRQTDPVSLRRLVDGDLNSITMKALEKARERRFGIRARGRYPEAHGGPAGAGLAAGQDLPNPEVSPQTQAGRSRHSRGSRISRVERSDGLVAFASRFRNATQADREGQDSRTLITRPAIRCLTTRCARDCRWSFNNRRSSG